MSTNPCPNRLTPESRRRAITRLLILWKQRPGGADDSREARLQFLSQETGRPIASANDLTDRELLRILDALGGKQKPKRERGHRPESPNSALSTQHSALVSAGADVIHLASVDQAEMIKNLFVYLGWNPGFEKQFLQKRFQKPSPQWLTHPQAHSAIRILLGIAAHKWLKHELGESAKISRAQIAGCILRVKQALRERRVNIVEE